MTTQGVPLNGGWADATDLINIVDTVDVPIVVVRADFKIAYFNKAAADLLRLSPSDVGRVARDISALAGLPRLEEQCRRVIAGGVESRVDFREGDRRFVVRICPYAKGDRQVTGAVVTFTNVTAFRSSIDQAIYEREFAKAILNTVTDPLVVLSADQRIQSGNRAFYKMFQVSRDETQDVPLYELGNGTFAPLRSPLNEMLIGSHDCEPIEVDHVIPGTGQRTLLLDARPLSLPGHSERRVLVTFQDITARKQAEAAKDLRALTERKRSQEELRRSEAFLAEAQRLSSIGSFSWRVATNEITWSDELYRVFGLNPPLTPERIRARVHPEDVSLFEKMAEHARDGGTDFEWQYRLMMPDRSIKYLHAVAHATRDEDGQLEYIAAVQDVTQRRLSEEALHAAQTALAHANRVATLGEIGATIAHEINQPLATIRINGETGLRWLDRSEPNVAKARDLINRMLEDARRASDIIERIRSMAAQRAPEHKLLSLDDVIMESLVFLRHEFQAKGVSVSLDLAPALPPVVGDGTQLQQVVVNLAVNAVQAMTEADTTRRRIFIRTGLSQPNMVSCAVEDSGPGIDPAHLPRVFDGFFTTKDSGMGLGLPISRSIIEAHDGHIRADNKSALGGARFSFALPANG
jgi:signal transduction histidine kinase